MIRHFLRASRVLALPALAVSIAFLLGGCTSSNTGPYHSEAYAPASLNDVVVKVSLKTQNVYVLEGDRLLMGTPTCVGKTGYPTPTGSFHVTSKNQFKRSQTYGYWVNGSEAHPGESSRSPGPGWTYVGYPMAFWVEFAPGFGFHEGPIWPVPRSHGCLHIHETASAKFFKLVKEGTPVIIAQSLPEDATYGRTIGRPNDYADPDPAPATMISPDFFTKPRENQLITPPVSPAPATAGAVTTTPAT